MNKIIFLAKSKASFHIFLCFFKNKILNIFVKRRIIKLKKDHQSFLKNKKITNNFFSAHAYNFFYYLSKLKSNFDYLEIGSYEGNSAVFVANNFKFSNIYCIDNWEITEEYLNHGSFSKIEKNFDYNILSHKNIIKLKNSSDEFFENNTKKFDVIYIDGHHYGSQVYKDCQNAWMNLNENGYLICDDYTWNFYSDIKDNPCFAINKFLKEIDKQYKLEKVSNSQIFIKKLVIN
jgi:predicted O-methyltransferase YrrM